MIKRDIIDSVEEYKLYLEENELSNKTVKKYLCDVEKFNQFITFNRIIKKSDIIAYKKWLLKTYKISSVCSYLVSINKYFKWAGQKELIIKVERIPRKICLENVISYEEYEKLLLYLKAKSPRDFLIAKTLAMTGIRVGELQYITYEILFQGEVIIFNKSKYRKIFLPKSLCILLINYCKSNNINAGCIFMGRDKSKPLNPSTIWKCLKRAAVEVGIESQKVYPHSFRHLFAKRYMETIGNIAELSDILGHSSIEITRIYTLTTASEKRKNMELLGL